MELFKNSSVCVCVMSICVGVFVCELMCGGLRPIRGVVPQVPFTLCI